MLASLLHGVDHLLMWILALCVLLSLHLSINELGQKDTSSFFFESDVSNDELKVGNRSSKVVIVLIDRLEPEFLWRKVHRSGMLTQAMILTGVWGTINAENPRYAGLEQYLTGNEEGVGPGVLSLASRVTFIGKESEINKLRLPSNFNGTLEVIDPQEGYGRMTDYNTDEIALAHVIGRARRKILWKADREVLIVQLSSLRFAIEKEGKNSAQAETELENTLSNLDKLYGELEKQYFHEQVSHFVTSIGQRVPLIAWGYGIDKARYADDRLFRFPNKQTSSIQRNLLTVNFAPLLACLLGGPPPANSMSTLPKQYLDLSEKEIGMCQVETSRRIMNIYLKQASAIVNGGLMEIATMDLDTTTILEAKLAFGKAELALEAGRYSRAEMYASTLISDCLAGIEHYRDIRAHLLYHLIFITLAGCFVMCATLLCNTDELDPPANDGRWAQLKIPPLKLSPAVDAVFIVILIISLIVVGIDKFPSQYLLFSTTMILPWWLALRNIKSWLTATSRNHQRANVGQKIVDLLYIFLSILTGITIANRVSIVIMFLASMGFLCITTLATQSDRKLSLWLLTALPVVAVLSPIFFEVPRDTFMSAVAGASWGLFPWIAFYLTKSKFSDSPLLILNTVLAFVITFCRDKVDNNWGYNAAWLVLLSIPLVGSQKLSMRVIQISMCVGVPFMLMSDGEESFALLVFTIHNGAWMVAESYTDLTEFATQTIPFRGRIVEKKFGSAQLRTSYFFCLYCMMSVPIVHAQASHGVCSMVSSSSHPTERFFQCEGKLFVPILLVSVLYVIAVRRTGGRRYYCLLVSFLYFISVAFFSFLKVYNIGFTGPLPTPSELAPVRDTLNVWWAVLFVSWVADLLLGQSFLRTSEPPPQIPQHY